ncbi:dTDP-4-dehydrorhamnose 3,5-epimerase family protein [Hyphomicrobium sp. MC8b]|uniref:dTDP-4-dehydrorhamnose 3,5-epimerase family protein n=1 Tax=Hyphomicrobium sp. MC8b TaxID=300273 RepID=UPI003919A441
MHAEKLEIPDVLLIHFKRFYDNRGFFTELYNNEEFKRAGIQETFVQDNFPSPPRPARFVACILVFSPHAQANLVRVSRGRIFDAAVDLRPQFSTYVQHVMVELSAETGPQLYIPRGLAHGFCTLEPDTEVVYKVSSCYAPHDEKYPDHHHAARPALVQKSARLR